MFTFYVDEVTQQEDDDLQLLISPFITATKIAGIYTGLSSHVSILYIVQFYFNVGTMIMTTNQSAQIEN